MQSSDKLSWQGSLQLVDHKKALGSISQLVHQAPELPVFIHSEPANDPLPKRKNAQQCFIEGWFISFMGAFLWCCRLLGNLYNINHPSPVLSPRHGCFIHLYPISVLPTLALPQVDSLQKIVSATCESMTCLGDKKCGVDCLHDSNRVYEAEEDLERVTWT